MSHNERNRHIKPAQERLKCVPLGNLVGFCQRGLKRALNSMDPIIMYYCVIVNGGFLMFVDVGFV